MRAARIENGLVADLWEVPALDCYGPDVALIEAPPGVVIGATYSPLAGFTNPPKDHMALPIAPISPRQIRQALSRVGLRQAVESAITAADQDVKDWWEFATQFERQHPMVAEMGSALGQTEAQLDALWELAGSL